MDIADKSVEDDAASPPRGYAELLERENKSLQQKNHELEKQLHQLRATSSRAPPSEYNLTYVL